MSKEYEKLPIRNIEASHDEELTMQRRREFRSRLWSLCIEKLEDRRVWRASSPTLETSALQMSLRSSARGVISTTMVT